VDGDGGVGYRGNFFGAAEDVDDIDTSRDVFQAWVRFLAQDFGDDWIDRNDSVAGRLEIGGDFMRGPARIGGEADDGDGFGISEDFGDGVGGMCGVLGEVKAHAGSLYRCRRKRKVQTFFLCFLYFLNLLCFVSSD
jgi:hypothetical protein